MFLYIYVFIMCGDDAIYNLRDTNYGPSFGVEFNSSSWVFSVVNGLCSRNERVVFAVPVLIGGDCDIISSESVVRELWN